MNRYTLTDAAIRVAQALTSNEAASVYRTLLALVLALLNLTTVVTVQAVRQLITFTAKTYTEARRNTDSYQAVRELFATI